MSERTMAELRAIVARDHARFTELADLWGELTTEYQDELLTMARRRSRELDELDETLAVHRGDD